ncbi:MAG TPA: cache domain-containing protein, partial [Burkholderiaceae bacterium]|nr:cache domain-containing protein [Burkholderiaceae bacterium]
MTASFAEFHDTDKQPRRLHRLHTRIGFTLGALMLLLALALATVLSHTAEKQILQLSSSNLENLSDQMARELSLGMDNFARDILNLASFNHFKQDPLDVAKARSELDWFKTNNPEFAYIGVVDLASARVLAATGGVFEGGDLTGRPVYDEGRKGLFLGDVHDAVRLAELLPRPSSGEPLRFLDVAAPINDEVGRTARVLVAHVGWQWTHNVRDHIFGPVKDRRGVEIFLVDTVNKVVLSSSSDIKVGTQLTLLNDWRGSSAEKRVWADGRDYLTNVAEVRPRGRFNGFGWRVVARQPYAQALGPVNGLRQAFFAGALFLGLGAAAVAWAVTARLVRPVRLLADAAQRAEAGAPMTDAPFGAQIGEVTVVQRAIRKLIDTAHEHREAQTTTQRQFATLAESLPQVVWLADGMGRLEYVNKPWVRQRDYAGTFHIGELTTFIYEDDQSLFLNTWRRCLHTGD